MDFNKIIQGLNPEQQKAVKTTEGPLLIMAGAGSGKTLTILGKIYYLINYRSVLPGEILCISFTRASANSLKEKILKEFSLDMPVYTFHKLGLEILEQYKKGYEISSVNTLDNIIHEFFQSTVLDSPLYMKKILRYFKIKKEHKKQKKIHNILCTFFILFNTLF